MNKDEADASIARTDERLGQPESKMTKPKELTSDEWDLKRSKLSGAAIATGQGNKFRIKARKERIEKLQWRLTELLRDAKVLLTEEDFNLQNRDVYLWCLALVVDEAKCNFFTDHQEYLDSFFTAKDQVAG